MGKILPVRTKSHLETRCKAAVATQVACHSGGRGRASSDLSRANLGGLGAAHEDGPTDGTIEGEEETTGSPVVFTGGESRPVKGENMKIHQTLHICHIPKYKRLAYHRDNCLVEIHRSNFAATYITESTVKV